VSGIVVIGAPARIRQYAMAGATVLAADGPAQVIAAWNELPTDTGLVILTADAAEALSTVDRDETWPLVAVMQA
jgi:vacuolar-type H+-ATPase subunit F/Vma7